MGMNSMTRQAPPKVDHSRRDTYNSGSGTKGSGTSGSNRGVFSAIDLGTNNCRLLIAKPTRNGFRVVDAFSRIVRLGEGVNTSGELSIAAMDRTIDALKICAEKVGRRSVTCMRHVATEACRAASNTASFLSRVQAETGLNIEVISAAEEARLAVLGCQTLIAQDAEHALVFDIGGGSTELIWVEVVRPGKVEVRGWMSMPWGVVNLTEACGICDGRDSALIYASMQDRVMQQLEAFEEAYHLGALLRSNKVQFLGTSGTVTTLASLHLKLPKYCRDTVDGAWLKADEVVDLSQSIAQMSAAERVNQPCIGRDRADLVVAGCAILESILSMWPVNNLRVADRGIREGILRGLMEDDMPRMNLQQPAVRT